MKNNTRHPELDSGSNIPKLRFPEFLDDWAVEELGKLGKFLGGGTPSKLVDEYWHGTIPWISSSDLNEDDLKTIAITRFINEKSILESATKLIPKGSVLFISRVGTGKLAINSVDLCTSQDFTNFIPTQIYNYFLGYYFLANKSTLTSLDQGTSIKGFSKSDLEKIKIIYPKEEKEQQKIADCLSSVDNLITAQSKKVETLKEHKKALMQQLFPSDGEKVPKLRFPEFKNAPKWEEKTLGELCDYWNGGSHENAVAENGQYYLISLNSLDIEGNLKTDMKKVNYLDNSLQKNDLVMVLSDVAHGNFLGLTAIIPNDNYVLNQRMAGLRKKENEKIVIEFLRLSINNNQKYFKKHGQGSSQLNLSKASVTDFPVLVPSTEEEQQKIANFLSCIDELITSSTKKVETLKEHKKALMQQLFPSKGVQ